MKEKEGEKRASLVHVVCQLRNVFVFYFLHMERKKNASPTGHKSPNLLLQHQKQMTTTQVKWVNCLNDVLCQMDLTWRGRIFFRFQIYLHLCSDHEQIPYWFGIT